MSDTAADPLTDAAFGRTPQRWPLPAAAGPRTRWLRAVAAGGQGHYAVACTELDALLRATRDPVLHSLAHSTRASFIRQLGGHTAARGWDGRAAAAAREARAAGFEHVNLDLIYGTPGETDDDWRATLAAAIEAGPDHISAYALIVEDGTRLAARIRRGELPAPDDDVAADRYLIADAMLGEAGYAWYEISNWARSPEARCRHNLLYWTGGDWWGVGPGAHSHVGGVRWWNVKHPAAYAARIAAGESPGHAREVLTAEDRAVERLMLQLRLATGHPLDEIRPEARPAVARALADGLLDPGPFRAGRAVLTLRGRLLADALIRDLA